MYAMDQTLHFEHRADRRPSRWEFRRAIRPSDGSSATPSPSAGSPSTAAATGADASPTHEFVD